MGAKKRVALKPHMEQIEVWAWGGKTDAWIASALGTSPSSVQSFRSRNGIHRRGRGTQEPGTVFEGVLDHGERDGYGLWLDPSVADDPIWKEHWAGVESLVVKVAERSIVLEPNRSASLDGAEAAGSEGDRQVDGNGALGSLTVERGRVKWFDTEKGYGFLARPTGEDLFVHRSEVRGDAASSLAPNDEVEYEVGENDRGLLAVGVSPVAG
jgi:cold shock CspA family protein